MTRYLQYPNYKNSADNWVGNIPYNWTILSLSRVLEIPITDGPHSTPVFQKEGIPFLSVDGIQDGELIFKDCRYISLDDHIDFSKKAKPKKNDILMGKAASIGKIARVKTDVEFNIWSPLALIRVREKEIFPTFVEYILKSNWLQAQIETKANSNTQFNIGMKDIPKLKILLPPLEEQKAIAHFLDYKTTQIDALIAKQKALLDKLAEKRTALISHAVTKGLDPTVPMKASGVEWLGEIPAHWKLIRIKHITSVKRGASPRPIDDPKYFDDEGEFAWVRIADVSASDRYLQNTTQRLSELGASLSVKRYPGDLFLSIAGTVGKPIITKINCCIHDGFVYFADLKESNEFFYYIFECGQPYLGLGKMGTQLNLNTDTVGSIQIGLPSQAEQFEIVDFLDKKIEQFDQQVRKIKHVINRLVEYRSALITNAVTGKIDVRHIPIPMEKAA